uniref:Uncharacterized protein n=1 Tax=Pseudictyota dubia TaxID=2749911 RepID=A0A7R9VQM6_9STRA|mmetsp:Transcript_21069/g.39454  ORF Transcript_21069/g.39454 Transcript_21069/m.39454 type:complete len:159 (+) Transcript_21069:45-521(+)
MKYTLAILRLAVCVGLVDAWTAPKVPPKAAAAIGSRQEFLQGFAAAAAAAATASPPPALADSDERNVFNHQYSDPKHPNCKRVVMVRQDGSGTVSGTDGSPGCPEDGSGKIWRLPVGEADGKTIVVDFSPKGGPANLKGVWDGSGIKWPDGNKWTVKD